jgi:phosphate ABC transporter phosphate-binding protein
MSNPATRGDFIDLLIQSRLLPSDLLEPYRSETGFGADLVPRLVLDRLLTPFQARVLLAGKTGLFFLGDKYKILDLIGTGGMGQVFLCEHLLLQRLVAVKLLQQAAGGPARGGPAAAVERLLREARAVATLDHPNIVRVHDMEWAAGVPVLVLEYVDGTSLHQVVAGGGPLSLVRACEYARQAANGLQHLHELGLVHRDVKPGNLLLDRQGVVKVLDLGLARFHRDLTRDPNVTARYDEGRAVVGTADFMAPEQAVHSSAVDIRADIYSLGATLYFLLTGRPPFEGESAVQKLVGHQLREPDPVHAVRPDLPADLGVVVSRMLAKEPVGRFQTPGEVARALARWVTAPVPPPDPAEMPPMSASEYRLGLSPASSSASVGAAAAEFGAELPLVPVLEALPGDTPGLALDSTADMLRPPVPLTPTVPVLDAGPGRGERERRRVQIVGYALAGSLALFLLAGAVWWLARRDRSGGLPVAPPTGVVVTGSGSTFIKPAMDHWAEAYERQTGVTIKYDGIGSGRGVENMIDRVLLFGCTDAPMTDAQLAKARAIGGEVIHIPLAMGAVVATYNLPDLPVTVKLTGPVLADIFLGKIRTWNHPAITESNPGVALPPLPITVVHRVDDSATTFIWTDFLSQESAEWESKVGVGNLVKWPTGEEADRNDGVARAVSRRVGAIGYVELSFALERNLNVARVKNQAGRYVEPTLESVTAAAEAGLRTIPADLRFRLTDAEGEGSYPIAGSTWAVLYANQPGRHGAELVRFLWWAIHDGQSLLKQLRFAPLPPALVERADEKLAAFRVSD